MCCGRAVADAQKHGGGLLGARAQPQSRVKCCNSTEGSVLRGVVQRRRPTTPQQQQCRVTLAGQANNARVQITVHGGGATRPPARPPPPLGHLQCAFVGCRQCAVGRPSSVRWKYMHWIFITFGSKPTTFVRPVSVKHVGAFKECRGNIGRVDLHHKVIGKRGKALGLEPLFVFRIYNGGCHVHVVGYCSQPYLYFVHGQRLRRTFE